MNHYRSLQTIEAIQYTGTPIPGVTCEPQADAKAEAERRKNNGCDTARAHLPHVHANVSGGLVVLKEGDWITPVYGGPFAVLADDYFRANWEVPITIMEPTPIAEVPPPEKTPESGKAITADKPVQQGKEEPKPEPVAEIPSEPGRTTAPAGKAGKVRGAGS